MSEEDIKLVERLIMGDGKEWYFDIVNNKRNNLDVDKYDYLARDSYMIGVKPCGINYQPILNNLRVHENQICYRDKEVWDIFEVFHYRYTMHSKVYCNKKVLGLQHMLLDALFEANQHFDFLGALADPGQFVGKTDLIVRDIQMADPKLPVFPFCKSFDFWL